MLKTFIAWLKSQFTKGKSEMTDIVVAAQADVSAAVTAVEGAVASVEAAVEPVVQTVVQTVTQTVVDVDASAAKIKAVYDKLGIEVHAWDQVVALAKAL